MKVEYDRTVAVSRAHDLSVRASAIAYGKVRLERVVALRAQAQQMRDAAAAWRVAADKTDILVVEIEGPHEMVVDVGGGRQEVIPWERRT
jgi:hypothetical protein